MERAYLVLAPFDSKLVRAPYRFFCFCGEVIKWRHIDLSSKYQGLTARV